MTRKEARELVKRAQEIAQGADLQSIAEAFRDDPKGFWENQAIELSKTLGTQEVPRTLYFLALEGFLRRHTKTTAKED